MEEKDIIKTTTAENEAPVTEENSSVAEAAGEVVAAVDNVIDAAADKVLGQDDDGKKLSIAALVLGILGIVGGYIPIVCYFTLVLAILGIVLGVKGRAKSITVHGKASGMATAGLVLGIIGTALGALGLLCTVLCSAAICASAAAGV